VRNKYGRYDDFEHFAEHNKDEAALVVTSILEAQPNQTMHHDELTNALDTWFLEQCIEEMVQEGLLTRTTINGAPGVELTAKGRIARMRGKI
jgi:hypothetical protein